MTETSSGGGAATEEGPPEPDRPAARLGDVTTTTLVHRRTRGAVPWWQDAVVYRVPVAVDLAALEAMGSHVSHVARLGANAVQIRVPDVDPRDDAAGPALDELMRRAHQRNVRVIVAVTGDDAPDGTPDQAAWHLDRVAAWLDRGVDGIDLLGAGDAPHADVHRHRHTGIDLGALQALMADRQESILTGAVSALDPESLLAHLHEDWLHISRDDRLAVTPWRADELRAAISDAYLQRDAVGAPAAWTLSRVMSHDEAIEAGPRAWEAPTPTTLRRRLHAATMLMLALPGVVYLRQGEAVDVVPSATDAAGSIEEIAEEAARQRGQVGSLFERYRYALRLRSELGLGSGHLAWVDDLPREETLAFVNGTVLVLINLGTEDLYIPTDREVLHASEELPMPLDGTVTVPPDTTVWVALD